MISENVFHNFYIKSFVDPFIDDLVKKYGQERVDNFINYHTDEMLNEWMGMFPPPHLYEIWDRWVKVSTK
jgi:hypothetical protein